MQKIVQLISDDGLPFESSHIQTLIQKLDSLSNIERTNYRNDNASAIAEHNAARFLIVSGPGTGKSHLFLKRINHWYKQNPTALIFVTSFVRKLVADLQNDIDTDASLTSKQKKLVTVSTLHKFARSIVEKNHGSLEWKFKSNFKIIGQSWKDTVWDDVLGLTKIIPTSNYPIKEFEKQLHNDEFENTSEWNILKKAYFDLCQFYNAAGFSDLILRARDALKENPQLNEANHFIIDEYQDFNMAEEKLIHQVITHLKSLLIVGDDEQVLYNDLKSSKPTLIRNLYNDSSYSNGMLPFCGRCSFHITKTAAHFISKHRDSNCIEKIYLPINVKDKGQKVQILACATPVTAVDYIEGFIREHQAEIELRRNELESGDKKDAFLLILTPSKSVKFYGKSSEKIIQISLDYQPKNRSFSDDYYKLLCYYSLANNPDNNFTFRKVFSYENTPEKTVCALIELAIENNINFCELTRQEIRDIQNKCDQVKNIIEESIPITDRINQIATLLALDNTQQLVLDITNQPIDNGIVKLEHEEDEEAELDEIGFKKMGAVELMTIVGSKGLSADHVIIIGFDNVNMKWISNNAFYVAMTRARESLHILTTLKSGGAKKAHHFLDQLPDDHLELFSYKKTTHAKNPFKTKIEFQKYIESLNMATQRKR